MTVKLLDPEEIRRALRLLEDLDNALPPDVWDDVFEVRKAHVETVQLLGSSLGPRSRSAETVPVLDRLIATYCPPHIQQQHGWEPRREEKIMEKTPTTVWVVMEGDYYEGGEVVAVFSTEEAAVAAVEERQPAARRWVDFSEHRVDAL